MLGWQHFLYEKKCCVFLSVLLKSKNKIIEGFRGCLVKICYKISAFCKNKHHKIKAPIGFDDTQPVRQVIAD